MKTFLKKFPNTVKLLDSAMESVFPTYAVGVHFKGESHYYANGCGLESLFDLASLTKVICTTTLCAIQDELTIISTEDPVQKYFPNFPSNQVQLSHLLDHSSGLPAWLDLHSLFHTPDGRGDFNPRSTPKIARLRYEEEILKSWVPADFEKKVTYSDLGFMLLGWALEKQNKSALDALFQEQIVMKAGLESLQFLPITPDVVPTENCPWRGHVLRGEVHDDNCFVLGGVSGHAGLFGHVQDVLSFGTLWLQALKGTPTLIMPQTAQKNFTFTHVPESVRSLGWEGVSREASSTGKYFSSKSHGHLGYTGTSLWIDPEKQLVVTLLTNRVHPSRTNEKIKTFRPLFHDALLQELGFGT